jgi:HAD superfamily hydrolase (TIGR01509 family)
MSPRRRGAEARPRSEEDDSHHDGPSEVDGIVTGAVLFDLGGVLVEWDGIEPLVRLSGGALDRDLARRFWLESPSARAFEKGLCRPAEFAAGAVRELGLRLRPEEFLVEFAAWDRGPLPGALDLLEELRPRCRLACLSNNNEIHWGKVIAEFGRSFSKLFASHETGLIKPDREAFEAAAGDLGVPVGEILFLDDNPECVEAALAAGMRAREVHGVAEARRALEGAGLLRRKEEA